MTIADVQERYQRFAQTEALPRSAVYAAWAELVATDTAVATVIARLPKQKRHPALVFAAARLIGADPGSARGFRGFVLDHADALVAEAAARTLQTNEPQRCAVLLPALARIPGPLSLIELGASAGLCLYPDCYDYRYDRDDGVIAVGTGSPVELRCRWRGTFSPLALPHIVQRIGVDVHPVRAQHPDDRRWLQSLVWPGEEARSARIDAALDIAAADPPELIAADLTQHPEEFLGKLLLRVLPGATPVITTPGVLPYLRRDERERLIAAIRGTDARWITLDAPALHDAWDDAPTAAQGFLLALDGKVLAAADPLGHWLNGSGTMSEGRPTLST